MVPGEVEGGWHPLRPAGSQAQPGLGEGPYRLAEKPKNRGVAPRQHGRPSSHITNTKHWPDDLRCGASSPGDYWPGDEGIKVFMNDSLVAVHRGVEPLIRCRWV